MHKRISLLAFPALILALLLSACAAPAPAATQEPSPPLVDTQEAASEPVVAATEEATEEAPVEGDFPLTVTDALGNEVTIPAKPQRIISLTLGTDEILLSLVGPERLIGVTYLAQDETTSNIASDPDLAKVANSLEADPEQVIALEPDLVIVASFTNPAVLDQLVSAGLTVYVVGNFISIDAMEENILQIGALVGEDAAAQAMVASMDESLAVVADEVSQAGGDPPRVLYFTSGGWVAGSATTVDDMIVRAGGVNAAAEAGLVDWNQVGEEAVLTMNPDAVILSPYVTDDEFKTNPVYATLNAVVSDRVVTISDAYMSATSQYIVLGVEAVAHLLHPELVSAP